MCIIIDINCLPSVFKTSSVNHDEFKPVFDWIMEGPGTVVFGGGTFMQELSRAPSYLRLFYLLKDMGKSKRIDPQAEIDRIEVEVTDHIDNDDLDDAHLVALLIFSGCKLICSADRRAYKYFQHKDFFKPAANRPKIYNGRSSKRILSHRNIAKICHPCISLTKAQRKVILSVNP